MLFAYFVVGAALGFAGGFLLGIHNVRVFFKKDD